jgi:hypothetical protein
MVMPKEKAVPEEEGVTPEREIVESVEAKALASKRCPDEAVSAGNEHTPAGDHAPGHPTETHTSTRHATEMHSSTAERAEMHSTSTKSTMHAAESAATTESHCWRCQSYRRSENGREETAKKLAFHDSDPPPNTPGATAGKRRPRLQDWTAGRGAGVLLRGRHSTFSLTWSGEGRARDQHSTIARGRVCILCEILHKIEERLGLPIE